MQPDVGDVRQPVQPLPVQVVEVNKVCAHPEVLTHIAHHALHFALRLGAIRLAGVGRKAIVQSEVQIARIPVNLAPCAPAQDGGLQVVVQHLLRHPAKVLESVLVTAQPGAHIRPCAELQIQHPRVAQRHDEGVQALLPALVTDVAKAAPVHLRLLPRQRLEAPHRPFFA